MKKKTFSLITIFILTFSLAFSFFDKVSFAADSVTYVYQTSADGNGSIKVKPGSTPFILNGTIKKFAQGKDWHLNILVYLSYDGTYHMFYDGVKFSGVELWSQNNVQFTSVSPSVPVIVKDDFVSRNQVYTYAASLVKDPSQIPINVTTYDTSLGSLQLQDSTSWRFLRYEPFFFSSVKKIGGYGSKVKLRTIFQDTTSTGQKYDKIQIMVRIKNIRSQFSAVITHPWNDILRDGDYYSYYLSDLKSPTTVDLQMIDYDQNNKAILYPTFQPAFDKLGLSKPAISNKYWFICDYTICYRPVTTDGRFGDWFYITPESNALGNNMVGGAKSISVTTGTSVSDEDPNSMAFNPLPEDSFSSRTASGNGETLGDSISNSNNSLIGGSTSSGGSLTSNITDLFSFFTDLPSIISTIFSWLPPWVLSLFGIGFALFVPIFIYKFIRG